MRVHRLSQVDGFIVFDLDDAPFSAGGTRLVPDVSEREVALLARAMTYKFGVLGAPVGGAKGGIRGDPTDPVAKADLMARYCSEILPLVEDETFGTGPDMGTSETDFKPLRSSDEVPSVVNAVVDGMPFEDLLAGFGVAVSASAALGGLEGRTVAIEGFGKAGGGVAREVMRRGGRVVGVSTLAGCVFDAGGLDIEALFAARVEHGDRCIAQLGRPVSPAERLFELEADVLVPGARTGVLDEARAGRVQAAVVAPAANVPYTAGGFAALRERGVVTLADFVCNAGAVIAYRSPNDSTPERVLADVDRRLTALTEEAMAHPDGPFAGACGIAESFLRTWREPDGMPDGPPLA